MITILPTNTTELRDRTVSLNCSTDANPDAHTYHWYFNGNLTGNSSSGVFNITVKEDGEYTCVPENKVGTGSNASVGITAVGEFHIRFSPILCSQYKDSSSPPPPLLGQPRGWAFKSCMDGVE